MLARAFAGVIVVALAGCDVKWSDPELEATPAPSAPSSGSAYGSSSPYPPPSGECPTGWQCTGPACWCTDWSSGSGSSSWGSGQTGGVAGGKCTEDADCARGCWCDAGECAESDTCLADGNCRAGFRCHRDRQTCVPGARADAGAERPRDATVDAAPLDAGVDAARPGDSALPDDGGAIACDCDGDCREAGMTSDEEVGRCVPAPTPPATCARDAECPAGKICCAGACSDPRPDATGPAACCADSQCGDGRCAEGRCHAACLRDADCGTGEVCLHGSCAGDPTPALSCVFSTDCGPSGFVCINATCHPRCQVLPSRLVDGVRIQVADGHRMDVRWRTAA